MAGCREPEGFSSLELAFERGVDGFDRHQHFSARLHAWCVMECEREVISVSSIAFTAVSMSLNEKIQCP